MHSFLASSVYFGAALSIAAYCFGAFLNRKFKSPLCNALLIASVIVIFLLSVFDIDYETYYAGAKYISYLLTPATICLSVLLYEQLNMLKENGKAIIAGVVAGVLSSMVCVVGLSFLFGLDEKMLLTLLPKSITAAMGLGVSEALGAYTNITVAAIIVTGILGNVFAEILCRLFGLTEPVAKGIAIGSASHAIGTAKAVDMGEVEGAASSLSLVLSGLITVISISFFCK